MSRTDVTICNLSLGKLGTRSITSLDEATKEGRACKKFYEHVRDNITKKHNWSCAIHRQTLTRLVDTPLGLDFDYYFQLPQDPYCLRAIEIIENPLIPFRVEGRRLLMNEASGTLKYIKRITTEADMDDSLVEAIACALALSMCYEITQSIQLSNDLKVQYADALIEGYAANQIEALGPDEEIVNYADYERGAVQGAQGYQGVW